MNELIPVPRQRGVFVRPAELRRAINEANEVRASARNISMATVYKNGDPHITVMADGFSIPPEDMVLTPDWRCRWWSLDVTPTRHTENIRRTGKAALAIFDSHENKGSITINMNVRELPPQRIAKELAILNAVRGSRGITPQRDIAEFDPTLVPYPRLLYLASPQRITFPISGVDVNGEHARDTFFSLSPSTIGAFASWCSTLGE